MKVCKKLFTALIPICMFLTACAKGEPEGKTAEPDNGPSNAEISEQAMDNFLAGISEGNYTMDAGDYLKTYVYSKDLVWFDYGDELYRDFAAMGVNDEVFQGFLADGGLDDVRFLGEGHAIDAAASRLPNGWLDISEGNIYNLFYNQQDEPLTFVSYEDAVKQSLLTFAGYNSTALWLMEEVYLEMDNIEPETVHLKAVVNNDMVARIDYDDIDIVITLGAAEDNEAAEAWMKAPVYPAARHEWDETDEFILNSVFLPGYGREAVPFPAFASYAFMMDDENFVAEDRVFMRDSHASEEDMADYIALLLKEGFSAAEEDGRTVYRRMLRDDYICYSSIAVDYDNGVNLTAEKYYDFPVYEGLAEVNKVIVPHGFNELPASDVFGEAKGTDRAYEQTESWLYFFTYDTVMYVDMPCNDRDKAADYLKKYGEGLIDAGFHVKNEEGEEPESYESENEFASFQYHFNDDDTVTLLFKVQKYIPADEAEAMIAQAGFPAIDLQEPIACRDLTRFEKFQYGLDLKAFITVSQTFADAAEAEAFLNDYEQKLNAAGFDRTSPTEAGTLKQVAIWNEDAGMLVGIDFFEQPDNTIVNFDFKAE